MFGEESMHLNKSDTKSLKLSPNLVSKLSPKFKKKNIQQADSDLSVSIRGKNIVCFPDMLEFFYYYILVRLQCTRESRN